MRWYRGIAAQVAVLVMATTAVSLAIVSLGVLAVGRATFDGLMVEHGLSTTAANDMYDQSVSVVVVATLVVAAVAAVGLSLLVARRRAAPLRAIADAARRVAAGDYSARAPAGGPAEVASLADSFNRMATELEAQEQMRRDFIANAAHELRTPLTNLSGYLEALRDGMVPADAAIFASLHEEVERLTRLSHSLDTLADGIGGVDGVGGVGGVGESDATATEHDLVAAIRMAVALARPGLERAGVRIDVVTPPDLVARFRPDALAQVLGNLLQNAMRYTPSGGQVVVVVEREPDGARITVSNTGEGIPPADLPHVFERFYRVDKSRDRASGGAGIGLAIVRRLVEDGGG
ncbi:MAG: sensor histidine kinase, partial [Candidatus Limnocylindrales bacterium]